MQKHFNSGDIVYWCGRGNEISSELLRGEGAYIVKFGMVNEQFSDIVYIDFLEKKEYRYIDGIYIGDFIECQWMQKRKKLPKGWTYNTKLYTIEERIDPKDKEKIDELNDLRDPQSVRKAYDLGLLVKADTKFHGTIETDITNEGYMVLAKYPMWKHYRTHESVTSSRLYFTYLEAQNEAKEKNAELIRQAELSDYDWSVEHIDDTLARWQYITGETAEKKDGYREFILEKERVEDIETRVFHGNVQWRYVGGKNWHDIIL